MYMYTVMGETLHGVNKVRRVTVNTFELHCARITFKEALLLQCYGGVKSDNACITVLSLSRVKML